MAKTDEIEKTLKRIADGIDEFIRFVKFAATGGMVLTAIYFVLKIVGVF